MVRMAWRSRSLAAGSFFATASRTFLMAVLTVERTAAERQTPVVLLAGFGHTRTDRGVPTYFTDAGARDATLSLAFVEVDDDKERGPRDYARRFRGTTLPFDIVWFTEEVEREDPCKVHKDKLEAIKHKPIGAREK